MTSVIAQSDRLSNNTKAIHLNIGDKAPQLKINEWLKGSPVKNFKKGRVYLLEFWATWCGPCIAAMPDLSDLARRYKDSLSVIGVNVYQEKKFFRRLKSFVDSMGKRMDYSVATDKDKFMEAHWLKASGANEGIPKTIIVNAKGQIAWIGHPANIETVIKKILDNKWDLKIALEERNLNNYLHELDDSLNIELAEFKGYGFRRQGLTIEESEMDPGMPDSALSIIKKAVQNEPRLKYLPSITFNTLYSLIKIDLIKAYEYGESVLSATKYTEEPPAFSIINAIELSSYRYKLTADIYELGAKAYQVDINQFPYPELANIPKYYHSMAWWYWLAKNKFKAIEAEELAINTLQSRKSTLPSQLAIYIAQLKLYNTCGVEE